MPYTKTILCLASSWRNGVGQARCVAGREVKGTGFGDWVRPVGSDEMHGISEDDRRYEDRTEADVLDIIQIEMLEHRPDGHQVENHVIDPKWYWTKRRTASWSAVQRAVDTNAGPLWTNNSHSSNGLNDRVLADVAAKLQGSLRLIKPQSLSLVRVGTKTRAAFRHHNEDYNLSITDPGFNPAWNLADALVCVSLAGAFKGYCYKLAAAIITPERAG